MTTELGKYDTCTNQRKVEEVHSSIQKDLLTNLQMQTSLSQTSSVNNRDTVSNKVAISSSFVIFEQTPMFESRVSDGMD
jgi:hypothetical protein